MNAFLLFVFFEAFQAFFNKDVEDELEIDNDELLLVKFEIRIVRTS